MSANTIINKDPDHWRIFMDACFYGDTEHLDPLLKIIAENSFPVNGRLHDIASPAGEFPLLIALKSRSLPVIALLLDHGADPNVDDGKPLASAIEKKDLELVGLLLDKGANPNGGKQLPLEIVFSQILKELTISDTQLINLLLEKGANLNHPDTTFLFMCVFEQRIELLRLFLAQGADIALNEFKALDRAVISAQPGETDILELLLGQAVNLADNNLADEKAQKLGKYARLSQAILQDNADLVSELLEPGDYASYSNIIEFDDTKPAVLTNRFAGPEVCKAFLRKGVDSTSICRAAVCRGWPEIIELCAETPGFDPTAPVHLGKAALHPAYILDPHNNKTVQVFISLDHRSLYEAGETVLHEACQQDQFEIIRTLVNKCGCKLDTRDSNGVTPLFHVKTSSLLCQILAEYPETDLNVLGYNGKGLLGVACQDCKLFASLLELGADLKFYNAENDIPFCNETEACSVFCYIKKMLLVDAKYLQDKLSKIMILENFEEIQFPAEQSCIDEIEKMKKLRISRSTSDVTGKNLLDFLWLNRVEAPRYSQNEIILKIYEENEHDFQKSFPNSGLILNRQLWRVQIRRKKLELALKLLNFATGAKLPEEITYLIFGHFANKQLERFSLESTITN